MHKKLTTILHFIKVYLILYYGVILVKRKSRRGYRIPKRIIVTGFLLLIEIAFIALFSAYITKDHYFTFALFEFLSVCCVVYLVNEKNEQSYKIAWIIFILGIPYAGWLFFLVFGGNRVFPLVKRKYLEIEGNNQKLIRQDPEVLKKLEAKGLLGAKQAKYLYRESGYPVYDNTKTTFFSPAEDAFSAILKDLKSAEKYIFIEFFIIADGYMWDEIHKILLERLNAGVEIKIIFDDFGSASRQHRNFVKDLKREGFDVLVFNQIRFRSNIFLNNRNHRKMIVIDGKVAYTGGFNIADEYINRLERFGHWLDSGIRIEGDAVDSFVNAFITMWSFTIRKPLSPEIYLLSEHKSSGEGFAQPYFDGPFDDHKAGEGIYLQMINNARRYVYITTPYLVINNNMMEALCRASLSGVDVRILTPKKWDKWYVHPVTQYHYQDLLKAGVKIYEYTPGFVHSKLFAVDDRFATVGTVNMDYRSFFFHFECGVLISNCETVNNIKDSILENLKESEQIILESWLKRGFLKKAKQFILHLFAPFM